MLTPRRERREWGARVGLDPVQLPLPLPTALGGLQLRAEPRCGCRDPQGCTGPTEPPGTPGPSRKGARTGAEVLFTLAWDPPLLLPAPMRLSPARRFR